MHRAQTPTTGGCLRSLADWAPLAHIAEANLVALRAQRVSHRLELVGGVKQECVAVDGLLGGAGGWQRSGV